MTAFLSLLVFGCGQSDPGEKIIASVGRDKITLNDFNERISNLPRRYMDVVEKRKGEYLDEVVNDTLLYQEAIRRNIHKDREVQGVIQEATKKILIAKLIKEDIEDKVDVSEDDIMVFYEDNREKYKTPEILRVSHILVPTREEADSILAELRSGEDFEAIARARSIDPTAQKGGDIGYFPKGQLMPEFEKGCEGLQPGEISEVTKTRLGYHIIKLTDRKEPEYREVDDVRQDIVMRLRKAKMQQMFNDLIAGLRENTNVQIDKSVLNAGDKEKAGSIN
ncbi:MAG: peptidylprolyl isomerase [Candidatus Omnitrophica bacterium]|nr:peptidylprolyl isomerase [Candidatus Omnitrophota bacterium]